MGGKGSAPAPPDFSPIAASSVEAARVGQEVSQQNLDWAKQQYADQQPYTKAVMQNLLDTSNQQSAAAQRAQSRYESVYQPVENQFVQTAQDYNTPARAQERSAAAQADVASAFQGQRNAALQSLESYGIDPSQTRYGALDLGARVSQAAAQAAAGTTSRTQSEATGLALQGEAINIGRGYPGQVASAYGTAINAGSGGVNAGLNTSSTYGNLMGNPTSWFSAANQANQTGTNALTAGYTGQMSQFNANTAIAQNQASGLGGLAGAAIGAGAVAIAV
jgi:hypothetical protein